MEQTDAYSLQYPAGPDDRHRKDLDSSERESGAGQLYAKTDRQGMTPLRPSSWASCPSSRPIASAAESRVRLPAAVLTR
jgi:hypothetical protein